MTRATTRTARARLRGPSPAHAAPTPHRRGGFGLIELLVVIAIITLLATLGLMVAPNIQDKDKVRNAATQVVVQCQDAQGRAAKKKSPVGVRFIVAPGGSEKPGKTDVRWVTDLQLVELPDPLIPNLKPLSPNPSQATYAFTNPDAEPRVRFIYDLADGVNRHRYAPAGSPVPPAGTIEYRRCIIENLTATQAAQVEAGCTIVMPVFGTWHKIVAVPTQTTEPPPVKANPVTNAFGLRDLEVQLEVFPDAAMGAGRDIRIYHFAIHLLPVPLVGVNLIPLPNDICVDLNLSFGPLPATTTSFDVLFGPEGKLVNAPTGQLFMYLRNYTKPTIYSAVTATGPTWLPAGTGPNQLGTAFRLGGEQHIVSIRNTGAIGHAPVNMPDLTTGSYPAPQTLPFALYTLARQQQNHE